MHDAVSTAACPPSLWPTKWRARQGLDREKAVTLIFPFDSGFHFSFLLPSSSCPFTLCWLCLVCFPVAQFEVWHSVCFVFAKSHYLFFPVRFCVCVRVIALPESPISREVHPYTSIFDIQRPNKKGKEKKKKENQVSRGGKGEKTSSRRPNCLKAEAPLQPHPNRRLSISGCRA